ncbi:uncharacterized protein Dwil_GK23781 [Drosophila willistoni]|uniref:DUF753 domain-containing protein n=1 Tax=Drosophila willistoni TaxID=7260 RepID=B4MTR4_DROWI|nr:uncharacterized protein Dwil_GK23781 [Drosophila willistoni]
MQFVALFLIFLAGGFSCITALRCYTCEDCDEYANLADLEIEVCSPPPQNGIDDDEDYDSNDSATVGIMPGNGGAQNPAPAPAQVDSEPEEEETNEEEEEEEEEEDDYDDRRRRRVVARQQIIDTPNAVCYTVRLQLNGTVITNRGCTVAMSSNRSAACENLYDPWNILGCDQCEENTCNGPINLSNSVWTNIASSTNVEWTMLASLLSLVLSFF